MAKKEKKVEIIPNLVGDLLTYVIEYDKIRTDIAKLEEKKDEIKEKLLNEAKEKNISKARGQIYSFSWKEIKQKKLSEKKLKEILIAKGMKKLIEDCEYEISYPQVYVNRRKGGENIF